MAIKFPEQDLPRRGVARGGADIWDIPQAGVLLCAEYFAAPLTGAVATGAPRSVALTAATASASGGAVSAGALAALTQTAATGSASGGTVVNASASGALAGVTLAPSNGSATGSAAAGTALAPASLVAVLGAASASASATAAAWAALQIDPATGTASGTGVVNGAAFGAPAALTLTSPTATALGDEVAGPDAGTAGAGGRTTRSVHRQPLVLRVLAERASRQKAASYPSRKPAKKIEEQAAALALDNGSESAFDALLAQWKAFSPPMAAMPAPDAAALFMAYVAQAIERIRQEREQIEQQDEEEAVLALLMA